MDKLIIGTVCVDSGQIAIVDPCYIKKDWNPEFGADYEHGELSYSAFCDATLNDNGYGEVGRLAMGVSTLYGDGEYPVYATFKDNRVSSITIDFDPNDAPHMDELYEEEIDELYEGEEEEEEEYFDY